MAVCHLEIRGSANKTRRISFEDAHVAILDTKCEHIANNFDTIVAERECEMVQRYMSNNLIGIWNYRWWIKSVCKFPSSDSRMRRNSNLFVYTIFFI